MAQFDLTAKAELQEKAERKMERSGNSINAISASDGYWYCLEHFDIYCDNESGTVYQMIMDDKELIDHPSIDEIIHDDTFQFEQFAGDIIPIEGITCVRCDSELYPPFNRDY